MNIYLDDSKCREALFPFTLTRHAALLRVGILTIKEKWERLTGISIQLVTGQQANGFVINANIIPTAQTVDMILKAAADRIAVMNTDQVKILQHPWQIYQYNDWAIREDFRLITAGRASLTLSDTNKLIGPLSQIFIDEGAAIEHSILNAGTGPVYIGKNAVVMEGNMIRGPFALCDNASLKMGSKIYGGTTIGPYCVAAGEIKNSVLTGYSNKAHDGYLGDSVLGEWCNLGAGTSNSNVKNTGGNVHYELHNGMEAISAGNKAGLIMGDYSRAAVNTTFNTGTVVGVSCNIFGDVSARKYIDHFCWGNERYIFDKAIRDIAIWKQMKKEDITDGEISMLRKIYDNN